MRWGKQIRKQTWVHLKQVGKAPLESMCRSVYSEDKTRTGVFLDIYIWPLDTLNRNVLYFYLELPFSCENSCQPNPNITQGQYLCAGTGAPLCCCVVGFGSSCHTTPRISNWKSVILTLWSVRVVSVSHPRKHNEGPNLTERKSFRHLTALNVFLSFFYPPKEHQRFRKDMNTRQRLHLLTAFSINMHLFFLARALGFLANFTGMWQQVCSAQSRFRVPAV